MGAASDPFGRQEAGKGQVEGWVAGPGSIYKF